ncbi:type II secretion system F family protein [Salipaludibacillus sp. CF4.18]|uniref:type II secretion system F family protein n=1 Tax=Salipaludibacillus sp. CF4.18 TaxID=3373081 RepID=UPI003EE680A4
MLLLYISFFIFISLLFYGVLIHHHDKKYHVEKRIQTYFTNNRPSFLTVMDLEDDRPFNQRILEPIVKMIKRKFQKRLDREKASRLEIKLLQAGQPLGLSPVDFKMIQTTLLILVPLCGGAFAFLLNLDLAIMMLFSFIGILIALFLPKYYLKTKAEKRSKKALKELPDTLDLLTISLEAGLGFDSALTKVNAKKQGVLAEEFKLCLEEIRLGSTRKEALNGITERLDLEEVRALIYSIIQAEKLGIGMVTVLRVQTEDIRERRKQKAEEAAMKAPIKMMFPLVLFIFPTLFIILLGPAILQFMEAF